jgi:cytochrome c
MRGFVFLTLILTLHGAAKAQEHGDQAKGAQIFKTCGICHTIGPDAKIKIGPPLDGIVGRPWASWPGYTYSKGMQDAKAQGKVWDEATLQQWLESPRKLVPGTKMIFPGLRQPQQRADVIAYLKQFDIKGNKK